VTLDEVAGDDRLTGGPGEHTLFGGVRDRVEGGNDNDTATIHRGDNAASDCERRAKPPVTITPGLTLLTNKNRMVISSIVARSRVAIACVKGCHPSTQLGVTARGAQTTCVRYGMLRAFGRPFAAHRVARS
jgi:hypothetical protein